MKKGNCYPNTLIALGATTLLTTAIMTFGFNAMISVMVPMSLQNIPKNVTHEVWIRMPMQLAIKVRVTNSTPSMPMGNGTLASGQVTFRIQLNSWEDEVENLTPIVYTETDGGIGSVQRLMLVFMDSPINFAKFYSLSFGMMAMTAAGIFWVFWYRMKPAV